MKCPNPNCNKEVSPEFNVCPWCGHKPKKCSKPEHQDVWLPDDARFCPRCGEPLSDNSDEQASKKEASQKKDEDNNYMLGCLFLYLALGIIGTFVLLFSAV